MNHLLRAWGFAVLSFAFSVKAQIPAKYVFAPNPLTLTASVDTTVQGQVLVIRIALTPQNVTAYDSIIAGSNIFHAVTSPVTFQDSAILSVTFTPHDTGIVTGTGIFESVYHQLQRHILRPKQYELHILLGCDVLSSREY